jgi:hypothetical protein
MGKLLLKTSSATVLWSVELVEKSALSILGVISTRSCPKSNFIRWIFWN